MRSLVFLALMACAVADAQQATIPAPNDVLGRPFAIRDKWVIGGADIWDYLTLDPASRRLYVAHHGLVDVVDTATGTRAGTVGTFGDAREVVLDSSGQYGYVSDSLRQTVSVFDRRSFRVVQQIPLACSPRSIALVPDEALLVAAGVPATTNQASAQHPQPYSRPGQRPTEPDSARLQAPGAPPPGMAQVAVIDTDTNLPLVYLLLPGDFRIVRAGRDGTVFVTSAHVQLRDLTGMPDDHPPNITRIDVASIAAAVRRASQPPPPSDRTNQKAPVPTWNDGPNEAGAYVGILRLPADCSSPQGLAVDSRGSRLFVACDNQSLVVMDANRGRVVAALSVGPGTDAIAYDESRGLIFTANGGGYGSLTVIRQSVNDDYTVVQNLPTMERARTLALDPSTGRVYLVTDLHGVRLDAPPGGLGTLRSQPLQRSFQVLVVGD